VNCTTTELTDPGFDYSILSEFRQRLLSKGAEQQLFDAMLTRFKEKGLLKVRGKQRTDSTHIVAAIRSLNRLELVGRTLQHALNTVAQHAPEWLQTHIPADWFERYRRQLDDYRLPKGAAERRTLAITIGNDGVALLEMVERDEAVAAVRTHTALEMLRKVWTQQYAIEKGHVRWREMKELPPSAQRIAPPMMAMPAIAPNAV